MELTKHYQQKNAIEYLLDTGETKVKESKWDRNLYVAGSIVLGVASIGALALDIPETSAYVEGITSAISAFGTYKMVKWAKEKNSEISSLMVKNKHLERGLNNLNRQIEKAKETYSTYKGKIGNKLETTKAS